MPLSILLIPKDKQRSCSRTKNTMSKQLQQEVAVRKQAEEQTCHNYDAQTVINALVRLSLETVPLEEILSRALDLILSIRQLVLESKGSIFLVQGDPEVLVMKAQKGLPEPVQSKCARVPFGRCLCGQAASTQQIQFADHLDDRHEIRHKGITPHGHYCIPITHAGRTLGVINTYVEEGHRRSQKVEEFLTAAASVLTGIIEHRRVEDNLREAEERYHELIQCSPDGIIIVDGNGEVRFVNPAAESLFAYKAEELIGELFGFPVVAGQTTEISLVHHHKTAAVAEIRVVETRWDGKSAYLASLRDVTERKQVETKLREIDKMKTEFISTASHELRTPLAIIKEAVSLVQDEVPGKIGKKQQDVLTVAGKNIVRLSEIIDSLLDISRIESGRMELHRTPVNINKLIEDTVSEFQYLAQEKGVSLSSELPPSEAHMFIDSDKVRQVLVNLISNSLKFTDKGGSLQVSCEHSQGEVSICVEDTGIGISREEIPKLFDRFVQVGKRTVPSQKGTGLGLVICKGIVELHGGRIWAESQINKGSKFYFTLPKLSPQQVFVEYLSSEIKRAAGKEDCFSAVVFLMSNLKQWGEKSFNKRQQLLEELSKVIESNLRREDGAIIDTDKAEIFVILRHTNKKEAVLAVKRAEEGLRGFISQRKDLRVKLHFATGLVSYPEEARRAEEILRKAREGAKDGQRKNSCSR